MKYFEFTAGELRRIIFGKDNFRKCPSCDKEGKEYWNEDGSLVGSAPLPEWGDNYQRGDCQDCDGLGYVCSTWE